MDVFLAIATVVTVALLLATKPTYRLRRSRPVVVLLSGGWLTLGLGVLLGPSAFNLVQPEPLTQTTPILTAGLGWIGFMVGIQLRKDVLSALPVPAKKLAVTDAVLTSLVVGPIAFFGLAWWTNASSHTIAVPAALLTAAAVGCSMETRSLRITGQSKGGNHLALVIRALGGLGSIIAISLFAVALLLLPTGQDASIAAAAGRFGMSIVVAGVIAGLARFALKLAGNSAAEQLAVVLGVVALAAGAATELGTSALFIALVAGAALANMSGNPLRRFQSFIVSAEHIVASLVALLAGIFIDPVLAPAALMLAGSLALARVVVKPLMTRVVLARAGNAVEQLINTTPASNRSPLYAGPARQSPIAIPLVLAYVLEQPSEFSRQLLAIVAITGLCAELLPLALATRNGRRARSSTLASTGTGGKTRHAS